MALATEAGNRLTEIVQGVQRVVDMIQHFAESTKQQSTVSGQISSSIQQVAQLSQDNESHIQGVATATKQFAALAEDLQTSLSRFTLKRLCQFFIDVALVKEVYAPFKHRSQIRIDSGDFSRRIDCL
jgi:ABC-type transporter Mla subunit MlaD